MKAILTTKYGSPDVLQIKEVAKPVPQQKEVLIRVKAIAVTSGDCRLRAFNPPSWHLSIAMRLLIGVFKPRKPIQGLWFAGVIEEAGDRVQAFRTGDYVYARTLDLKFGANAEYVCLPEHAIIGIKPGNLTFEEAVSIPFGGLTALHFLRKFNIRQGESVLIYGASGSVGTSALQLAKYFGAEVTAVCSTENIDWVKKLGADRMIDYKMEKLTDGNFDIVFDAVGYLSRKSSKQLLKPGGRFISILHSGHARGGVKELHVLTDLAEKGIIKPVLDRCYSFEEMAAAHRHVDTGHKKGNVVVSVDHGDTP